MHANIYLAAECSPFRPSCLGNYLQSTGTLSTTQAHTAHHRHSQHKKSYNLGTKHCNAIALT